MRKAGIDPRNENYRFNLANIYLVRQPDQALAILQSLEQTVKPEMASQVARAIQSIPEFQQFRASDVGLIHQEDTAGSQNSAEVETDSSAPTTQGPKLGVPIFLRGTIAAVDCSAEPSAIRTVASGPKTTKLNIADKHYLMPIGTDEFSCSWTNQKVAVNSRHAKRATPT